MPKSEAAGITVLVYAAERKLKEQEPMGVHRADDIMITTKLEGNIQTKMYSQNKQPPPRSPMLKDWVPALRPKRHLHLHYELPGI